MRNILFKKTKSFSFYPVKILLFVLAASFLFSCDKYYNIPENMKSKYKKGDTIIFKSSLATYDTFVVKRLVNGYVVEEKQYHYEYENINCAYAGSDNSDSLFFINNEFHYSYTGFVITWGNFKKGIADSIINSIIINNEVFKNVYVLSEDTNKVNSKIYKLYFSRNYGVLKYWFRNKTEWEFYRAIIH